MSRIQIKLPKKFTFATDIEVRITDINYGNHLGNDAILQLVHEARVRFLQQHGFSELDICGFGLIMTDAAVVYKSQAHYGDALRIEVTAAGSNRYGCDLYYRITKSESGREVARAKTGIVLFDYAGDKMARMPDEFKKIIASDDA